MCGILGQVNKNIVVDESSFSQMLQTLQNRGPDGSGVEVLEKGKVRLGHRRLTIIDLTHAGSQPMSNEDASIWLVFNGEIYNYISIKLELIQLGHTFKSNSDSECIIHAYEEWGYNCVNRFRGIFAFGLYDCNDHSLFIARDHLGVKPLYYCASQDSFVFASQPRAIIKSKGFDATVDKQSLSIYLGYGNVGADRSIYQGINKLLPGHWLLLKNSQVTIKQYWKLNTQTQITDFNKAIELVRHKIFEAVEIQTVSDVPLGVLLSGGIDSTIVLSVLSSLFANRIPSFTVGFSEKSHDERAHAYLASRAFNSEHREYLLTYNAAYELLPNIVEAYDEPFHLNGLFPYFALSQLVQSNGLKVVHGGDGADEIFAGYLWYDKFSNWVNSKSSQRSFLGKLQQKFISKTLDDLSFIQQYFTYNGFWTPAIQRLLLGQSMKDLDLTKVYEPILKYWDSTIPPVLAAQLLDINCFLVDHCLTKVDRASMHCGVEVRVPFLDVELVQLAFSIDHSLIYYRGERKAVLKRAMAKSLPLGMDTRRKKGFSSPLSEWLQRGLSAKGKPFLLNGSLCANEYLCSSAINRMYEQLGVSGQLLLISLELWHRRWIDNEPGSVNLLLME